MKARRAHVIYLPKQAQDLLVGLQMCAGGSEYLVPGRYNFRKPLSNAALNSLIDRTVEAINKDGEKYRISPYMTCAGRPARCCTKRITRPTGSRRHRRTSRKESGRFTTKRSMPGSAPICCSSGRIWLMLD